jgi:hypothetical protein
MNESFIEDQLQKLMSVKLETPPLRAKQFAGVTFLM